MEKKELFERIEKLLPSIRKYYETRYLKVSVEELELTREIWEKALMRTKLQTSCSTCVSHAFDVIYSYYEREHPKYLQSIEPEKPTAEIVDDIQNDLIRQEVEVQKAEAPKKKTKKVTRQS